MQLKIKYFLAYSVLMIPNASFNFLNFYSPGYLKDKFFAHNRLKKPDKISNMHSSWATQQNISGTRDDLHIKIISVIHVFYNLNHHLVHVCIINILMFIMSII